MGKKICQNCFSFFQWNVFPTEPSQPGQPPIPHPPPHTAQKQSHITLRTCREENNYIQSLHCTTGHICIFIHTMIQTQKHTHTHTQLHSPKIPTDWACWRDWVVLECLWGVFVFSIHKLEPHSNWPVQAWTRANSIFYDVCARLNKCGHMFVCDRPSRQSCPFLLPQPGTYTNVSWGKDGPHTTRYLLLKHKQHCVVLLSRSVFSASRYQKFST